MQRRQLLKAGGGLAGLSMMPLTALATGIDPRPPILVAVELSGGNDGLNSVVPYADDAYYRHRPTLGLPADSLLRLDDHYGFNPGMLGLHRLWQDGHVAIVHGCGYERPSFSHFTSMAYWHTGAPHSGSEFGWMGRVADVMASQRRDNMIINVGANQSLAVKSASHTPVVFDDPERFQRNHWMAARTPQGKENMGAPEVEDNPTREFLYQVDRSAQASSQAIRAAWRNYQTPIDYGIAPMDLPKVAACIEAGLDTQLYHVSFRNNSFDTHVQQPALHRRLLSYACDGIHGFVRDLQRIGQADRVVLLVYSEFGRRVPENANLGTDHGTANVMFMIGEPVVGGHYGQQPSLTQLVDGDNMAYTTDFRRVYATAIQSWLGGDARRVLGAGFEPLAVFG